MLPIAILAGGLATRMRPLTGKIPKSLLDAGGKPFIARQLDLLKKSGAKRVVICCGYLGEQIENYVKDGSAFGLQVSYSRDGESLLGTGGALKKALPHLGDNFMTLYGDSYLDVNYGEIANFFLKTGKSALMTVYKNDNKHDKSNVVFVNGEIKSYDKKKPSPQMNFIDYGLGCFKAELFEKRQNPVFDLCEIYREQIENRDIAGLEVKQRFYEIGSPEGLMELSRLLADKDDN